jgi:hypothetical protein
MMAFRKKHAIGEEEMKNDTPSMTEYLAWRGTLSSLDRMNFDTLIDLPNAIALIAKMPEGEYKRMAIAGLALNRAVSEASQ